MLLPNICIVPIAPVVNVVVVLPLLGIDIPGINSILCGVYVEGTLLKSNSSLNPKYVSSPVTKLEVLILRSVNS